MSRLFLSADFHKSSRRPLRRRNRKARPRRVLAESLEARRLLAMDFGDAPSSYGTLLADDGARHEELGPTLGDARDAEDDGVPSADASADDGAGAPPDDESGVQFTGPLSIGRAASATVNVQGGAALLDAWIDFDNDGTFDPSEQIADDLTVVVGDNIVDFSVPDTAVVGNTFARFRLSTAGVTLPTGAAADGEVEDYHVTLSPTLLVSGAESGTLDTVHYIPPVHAPTRSGNTWINEQYLALSTLETTPFDVTISNQDGLSEVVTISRTSPALINLSESPYGGIRHDSLGVVEDSGLNAVNVSDGLILNGDSRFYANLRHTSEVHGFSLTAKGRSALGTRFRSGHLRSDTASENTNDFRRSHFIAVMATEDGTTVEFGDISSGLVFRGADETPSSVVLDRGESYVIAVNLEDIPASLHNDLNGTLVASDKPIVMNSGSWTAGAGGVSGAAGTRQDIGIDQILPVFLQGTQYVLAKGQATNDFQVSIESPIVVADIDNTQVFLNDDVAPVATINAGEYFVIDGDNYSATNTMFIRTSEPAYVYQTTAGTNDTANVGLNAVVAAVPLEPQEVLIPFADQMGTPTLHIIAPIGAVVELNGATLAGATPVVGTPDYEVYRNLSIPASTVQVSSEDPVYVSFTTVNGFRTTAAYFSGVPNTLAVDDSAITAIDKPVTIAVRDNDVASGTNFSLTGATDPANGSITINPDDTIEYVPDLGFVGMDTFDYTIDDGEVSDVATVFVTVLPNTYDFTLPAYETLEGDTVNTTNVVEIERSGDLSISSSIDIGLFAGAGAPAIPGSDFTPGPVTVNFLPGETIRQVPIEILGDTTIEGDEIVSMAVLGPEAGTVRPTATLTLLEDDIPTYDFGLADFETPEGDAPNTTNVVMLERSFGTSVASSVEVVLTGISAGAGVDFTAGPIVVNFGPGETVRPVPIEILGDLSAEPNETLGLSLDVIGVGQSGDAQPTSTLTIIDDDTNAPDAVDDLFVTDEDTLLVVDVLANDTDHENNIDPSLTVNLTSPSGGSLVNNGDGTFDFSPIGSFDFLDSTDDTTVTFDYRIEDTSGLVDTATVTIRIDGVNDAPVANPDAIGTNEISSIIVDVLANDTDVDGDDNPGNFSVDGASISSTSGLSVSPAAAGTVSIVSNRIEFDPGTDFLELGLGDTATVIIDYTMSDDEGATSSSTLTITVNAINDAPAAADDAYETEEDVTLIVSAPGVLANDTDIDGDTLMSVLVSDVANGTLALNGNGGFTYTPSPGFFGTDGFTYMANDGTENSAPASVTITVIRADDPPIVVDDNYSTDEDTTLTVSAPGVLANDSDPDGNPLTATLVTGVAHGTLDFDSDGGFVYTPVRDFFGQDVFTYIANDGTLDSVTATVTITVNPVNDPPLVDSNEHTIPEGTQDHPLDLNQPIDFDGDPLTITVTQLPAATEGTVTLADDTPLVAGQSLTGAELEGLLFDAATGFDSGSTTFGYQVSDGTGTFGGTSVISVLNEGPMANDDAAQTDADVAVTVDVLANDTDAGGDPLTIIDVSTPSDGSVVLNPDQSVTYTPDPGFEGIDTFTYTVTDDGGETDSATVTVAVGDGVFIVPPPFPVPCAETTFLIFANLDQAEDITYEIDWESDGEIDDTIVGPSPITASHLFGMVGMFDVTVTATDNVTGASATATVSITVQAAGMVGPDVYACGDELPNRIIASAATGGRVLVRVDDGFYGPFLPGPGGRFVAFGFGSNDTISVAGNVSLDSVLHGGDGRDYLASGSGDDTLYGGNGNDTMLAGEGNNTLLGEDGNDHMVGRAGVDMMFGGNGNDSLDGGAGNDLLWGESGNDKMTGGDGDDILRGDLGNDELFGFFGNDALIGGAGVDDLNGNFGRDLLIGGSDRDLLKGNRDEDILIGGSTDYDQEDDDLRAILSDWATPGESMDQRIERITFSFHALNSSTVHDDGVAEKPIGGGIEGDFFLLSAGDVADDFNPIIDRALPL